MPQSTGRDFDGEPEANAFHEILEAPLRAAYQEIGKTPRFPKTGARLEKLRILAEVVRDECDKWKLSVETYVMGCAKYYGKDRFAPSKLQPSAINRRIAEGHTGRKIVPKNSAEAHRRRQLAYERLREETVDRGIVLLVVELVDAYEHVRRHLDRPADLGAEVLSIEDQFALRNAAIFIRSKAVKPLMWVRACFEIYPVMRPRLLWEDPASEGTPTWSLSDRVMDLLVRQRKRATWEADLVEEGTLILESIRADHTRAINMMAAANRDDVELDLAAALCDIAEDLSVWSWAYYPQLKTMIRALADLGDETKSWVVDVQERRERLIELGLVYGKEGLPR